MLSISDLRRVSDFPIPGINFIDIQPIFSNPELFKEVVDDLVNLALQIDFDTIVCLDARGFLIGPMLGYLFSKPVYLVRKQGKLPPPVYSFESTKEYGSDILDIPQIPYNSKVLIIDDLIATGGTIKSVAQAIRDISSIPVAALSIIDIKDLHSDLSIPVYSLLSV